MSYLAEINYLKNVIFMKPFDKSGRALKKGLKRKNMKQSQLAGKIHCGNSTVSMWCRGERPVSRVYAIQIAPLLDIPLADLLIVDSTLPIEQRTLLEQFQELDEGKQEIVLNMVDTMYCQLFPESDVPTLSSKRIKK